jgi:hypothetical protein
VYGRDVRPWTGYQILRDIRDLHTLAAPLRLAATRPDIAEELHRRIRGLVTGDTGQRWRSLWADRPNRAWVTPLYGVSDPLDTHGYRLTPIGYPSLSIVDGEGRALVA